MINPIMHGYGSKRSAIRDLFEYGLARAAVVGRENVLDFSLGNPSVPPPDEVDDAIIEQLNSMQPLDTHGYTSAAGCPEARAAIAASLNRRYGTCYSAHNLYLTCGAAAAVTAAFRALTIDEGTEFLVCAPFFPEYSCFAAVSGGRLVVVPPDEPDFQINFDALEKAFTPRTQAMIINTPNNPSGAVYSQATLERLSTLLSEKSRQYGHPVYLISDEPYRELYYEDGPMAFPASLYPNTIICYSYSKSLSIPGERIGYVLVPDQAEDARQLLDAVAGAARSMGYVCAPSLMQRVVARCADLTPDLEPYRINRDLLYQGMTRMGYECVRPQGAFYLFVKAPGGSAAAFSQACKARDLLVVPGDSFGCPNYVRLSYCVSRETIEKALPRLEGLICAEEK